MRDPNAQARRVQIFEQSIGIAVVNERAGGQVDVEIAPASSGLASSFARSTVFGEPVMSPAEIEQRGHGRVRDKDHVTAFPAVAAVGAAFGQEPFTPKADTAVSALAGPNIDFRTVDEHGSGSIGVKQAVTRTVSQTDV